MRKVYSVGAVLGTLMPYAFIIQFLGVYGLDIPLFVQQMFSTPIAAFFVTDVIILALVLLGFIVVERRRLGMENLWVYVLCTLLVGVSLALPLFLFFREAGI